MNVTALETSIGFRITVGLETTIALGKGEFGEDQRTPA